MFQAAHGRILVIIFGMLGLIATARRPRSRKTALAAEYAVHPERASAA